MKFDTPLSIDGLSITSRVNSWYDDTAPQQITPNTMSASLIEETSFRDAIQSCYAKFPYDRVLERASYTLYYPKILLPIWRAGCALGVDCPNGIQDAAEELRLGHRYCAGDLDLRP